MPVAAEPPRRSDRHRAGLYGDGTATGGAGVSRNGTDRFRFRDRTEPTICGRSEPREAEAYVHVRWVLQDWPA
ncbi:hypothetical protein GCM10027259_34950 [Micromonospora palomenae]